jgi:5'-nucleotidase
LNALITETNFPWLLSNALDIETGRPLADANLKHIIEINGLRVGLVGLVEEDWIATLSTIDYDEIIYQDFVHVGRKLAKELKETDVRHPTSTPHLNVII